MISMTYKLQSNMYGNEVGGVSQLKTDCIDKLIDEMKLLTAKK